MREKRKNRMNACYKCKHRGTVPGDRHSACKHPKKEDCNVVGDKYGKSQGWFFWPLNFDPVWLINCDGFEPKE